MSDKIVKLPPGHMGPDNAERVTGGMCAYPDCDGEADYIVWMEGVSFLTCDDCSREKKIHADDLLEEPQ